jgi:hypothetical protein
LAGGHAAGIAILKIVRPSDLFFATTRDQGDHAGAEKLYGEVFARVPGSCAR